MTAIEFNNISKQYRLGLVSTKTLSHDLNRWFQMNVRGKEDPYLKIGSVNDRSAAADSDYVWALRNIDFKVEQGDVVGIIGKNGAGKSTLLKILSRVTAPTTGTIRAKGRIASLLEVGTGFHPEMTGRENIYMNGAIMGMTKAEIASKIDEIIDFSGCERYIDTPVKRYSSGMTVRLGFAIAAHLDPEILVVDEVLAVGDAEFQKKAIGKMQEVSKGDGRTVLFVSHNMLSMRQLCTTGILLDKGGVCFSGNISDTIATYIVDQIVQSSFDAGEGDKDVLFLEYAKVYPTKGTVIYNSSEIIIEFGVTIGKDIPSLVIGFNINSSYGHPLARADYNDNSKKATLNPGSYIFKFKIPPLRFSNGDYKIVFDVAIRNIRNYATSKSSLSFNVTTDEKGFGNFFCEDMIIKSSIMRENWFDKYEIVK
ncbi:ABC transporter ATP-binding protein [Bacteroides sp.]|uniref:ABC transporter ATP-binding protein n=1 Tax=Bacteroides sp. TaxID=29523 RepID=UPI002602D85F|nr:ABC transporter ATP-binding protein [Bacteroides sp.]MDD3038763.1 ABC transporter ATP-binding protein [Bacteroides sp.]